MFWDECGETLEQVGWRNCGCPIMGSIQSQVGWSFERPGLLKDVPANGRKAGTRLYLWSLQTKTIM